MNGKQEIREFVSDRFHRLCILPRNARVTKDTLLKIWCISNEEIGWKMVNALKESHLLLEFEEARGESFFGLHDVVLDHCIEESKNRGNNKYGRFHREFLSYVCKSNGIDAGEDCNEEMNAYWDRQECDKVRPWWDMFSNEISFLESYMLGNLFRHLIEGARLSEAVGLISLKEWTQLGIKYGGIARLQTEFNSVDKGMSEKSGIVNAHEKSACEVTLNGLSSIRKMISKEWPSISNDPHFVPAHALWHLQNGRRNWVTDRYLESSEKFATSPWIKPRPTSMQIPEASSTTFNTNDCIQGVSIMWEGKQIIAATSTILYWIDMKTMGAKHSQQLETRNGHDDDEIKSIALCEEEDILVLGLKSGQLQFVNASTGKFNKESLCRHEYEVSSVAICAEGRTVVSGSSDGAIRIWDAQSGTAVGDPLCAHKSGMASGAISAVGQTIVTGSYYDGTIRIWDAQSGTAIGELMYEHESSVKRVRFKSVFGVAVSGDRRKVISVHADGKLRMWDVETRMAICEHFLENTGFVHDLALSADDRTVVYSTTSTLVVFDLENGTVLWEEMISGFVNHVTISEDGRTVVSGFNDGAIRVWDIRNMTAGVQSIEMDRRRIIREVGMSVDGRSVVSLINDHANDRYRVHLWDAESGMEIGEPLRIPRDCSGGVSAVTTNGRRVATGSWDGTVRVWDKESGMAVCLLHEHKKPVSCLAISADGRTVVSAYSDCSMWVWDAESGTALGERLFSSWIDRIEDISMSTTGQMMISSHRYGEIRLWDMETRALVESVSRGIFKETAVAMSANGETLVSCDEYELQLWNRSQMGNELSYFPVDLPNIFRGKRFAVGGVACVDNVDRSQTSSRIATIAIVMPTKLGDSVEFRPLVFDLIIPNNHNIEWVEDYQCRLHDEADEESSSGSLASSSSTSVTSTTSTS